MASSTGSPPSAQLVGNAFVHQYYNILYQSPDLVYRFYQECSKLGRPEAQGVMTSITTMQAINEKILSMDYAGLRAELKTVDAQESLDGGVLLLVTGYITGKDNVRRTFTQSFFLATQDKGYFVLNDIFRYVEDANNQEGSQSTPVDSSEQPPVEQEVSPPVENNVQEHVKDPVPELSVSSPEEEKVIVREVHTLSHDEEGSHVNEETPEGEVIDEVPDGFPAEGAGSGSSIIPEDAPKKSWASIVKVKKEIAASSVSAPSPSGSPPAKIEKQATPDPEPTPVPEVTAESSNATETSSVHESEADGHAVYVKSLPLNATPAQVEEEFKRFGPIKPGGVQVRSHKQQGFCFGFVEFETASAVQSAIEASPVSMDGRQVIIEEKRPTGSRGRSRFSGRVGGFRNEGGRGRYGGGRGGYGRGGDFRGRGGRGGGDNLGYQRVNRTGPASAKNTAPKSTEP